MDDFEKQKYRLSQQYWNVQSNNGTTLTAVNIKTGEVYNGATSSFNAIFASPPDMDPDDDLVKAKTNPLTGGVIIQAAIQH